MSCEGRSIYAYESGTGPVRINLIGGCHADELVGPRFLFHLSGFLDQLESDHPTQTRCRWTIVLHVNPDGAIDIRDEMKRHDLHAMSVLDQMRLQWQLIVSGIDMVGQVFFRNDRF